MATLSCARCCLLLLSVLYLSSIHTTARRSGGGGGGGSRSSSSGGGGFGGGSRSSFGGGSATARTGGGYGGGATRYGASASSGSSGRYGGGAPAASSPIRSSSGAATRTGGGAAVSSSAQRYGSSSPAGGANRYGSSSPSSSRGIGTGTAVAGGAAGGALGAGAVRYGGGSFSGAGSGAGRVGAAPTLTRYGSQQSSAGGVYGSSGGGASRWGSSAASGTGRATAGSPMDSMRNRFAGGGSVRSPSPSAGNARPNYGGSYSGNTYNRPQVHTPAATRSQPTKVVYSTTYNNYHSGSRYGTSGFGGGSSFGGGRTGFGTGSLVATGLAAGVGGYALGSMMGRLSRPFGYGGYGGYGYGGYGGYGYGGGYGGYGYPVGGCLGGCSPYTTYVPYRDRYQEYYPPQQAPQPAVDQNPNNNNQNQVGSGGGGAVSGGSQGVQQVATTEAPKNVDLCMLARWNRELAFAEMPNMALDFLANNNISGNSTSDKSKFMFEFFTVSVDAYDQYNTSADVFAIPAGFDMNTCNIKVNKNALTNNANTVQSEEPIMTSLRHMLSLYSNKSTNPDDLKEVVDAAKACLPQGPIVTSPEVLGCIDFSLSPEQLLKLDVPHSMFGSGEICRRQLSPDMFKCVPKAAGSPCKMEHLKALNLFARNYYLCSEAADEAPSSATVPEYVPPFPATTRSSVIYITTAKPGFWSRIFG
ncbi:hypothetical protein BV898_12027 [Hypsibius exemplaris]|uniref:Uncharacterized protein n=1 Tax=Hypsibius exemplaris TaxID=2072580 RepID=A0A1W0WF42_HYPEX|nr:hypothetical protein BV898_12027 [Hypsibius exemplaris]